MKINIEDSHGGFDNRLDIQRVSEKTRQGVTVEYLRIANMSLIPERGYLKARRKDWERAVVKVVFVHGAPVVFTDINELP